MFHPTHAPLKDSPSSPCLEGQGPSGSIGKRMDEHMMDVRELAESARQAGYDNAEKVRRRLVQRMTRDVSYLHYRERKGWHTSHDEVLAEDVMVTALAVALLERLQGE
jgi:hypothetical protein